jgi:DNA-directed RNA polymerase specialized sigma24 family protein
MTTYKRLLNKGREEEKKEIVVNAFMQGYKAEEIAAFLKMPVDKVDAIIEKYIKSQGHAS